MKSEGSRTGRFEIAQVPIEQVSRPHEEILHEAEDKLPCDHWCLICKDIRRNIEMNPSMSDMGDPCDMCPDCSGVPEWTL